MKKIQNHTAFGKVYDPMPYQREVMAYMVEPYNTFARFNPDGVRVVFAPPSVGKTESLARFYDTPLGKPWSAEGERRFRVFENGKLHDPDTHAHMRHLMYLWTADAMLAASILDGRTPDLTVKRSVTAVRQAWRLLK